METTKLNLSDKLPLTCTRSGTCCHGKKVNINPWELANLANEKKMKTKEFGDLYCEFGGIRLKFNNEPKWKDDFACSQYVPGIGCQVYNGRPLACRLYPLGRQKQSGDTHYIFQGHKFPCLAECSDVTALPYLSVIEYIEEQGAENFELAQDGYLEVMQNLAEAAFILLLDSGLAQSGDKKTIQEWRRMGRAEPKELSSQIGDKWMDLLMFPEISVDLADPISFINRHNLQLQEKIEESFGDFEKIPDLSGASSLLLGLALHLGRGLGAKPKELSEHWINTAKNNGAKE